jgi:hypothetical protein
MRHYFICSKDKNSLLYIMDLSYILGFFYWTTPKIVEEEKIYPPIHEEPKNIDECSWAGCMIEFTNLRKVVQRARVRKRNYAFCCEDCYLDWLGMNAWAFN